MIGFGIGGLGVGFGSIRVTGCVVMRDVGVVIGVGVVSANGFTPTSATVLIAEEGSVIPVTLAVGITIPSVPTPILVNGFV